MNIVSATRRMYHRLFSEREIAFIYWCSVQYEMIKRDDWLNSLMILLHTWKGRFESSFSCSDNLLLRLERFVEEEGLVE